MEKPTDKNREDVFREIVLFQDENAGRSHKALFSLDDACYLQCRKSMIDAVSEVSRSGLSKLHVAAGWENMLKLAVWTCDRPLVHDVITLIKKCGAKEVEVGPFRKSDINDIFPWLYYGNRFDILRKVCNAAKAKIELKIDSRKALVYCHLVADDTEKIVASSL